MAVIRVTVAIILAAAMISVALPAVDRATSTRSEHALQREATSLAVELRTFVRSNDAVPPDTPGATRRITVEFEAPRGAGLVIGGGPRRSRIAVRMPHESVDRVATTPVPIAIGRFNHSDPNELELEGRTTLAVRLVRMGSRIRLIIRRVAPPGRTSMVSHA